MTKKKDALDEVLSNITSNNDALIQDIEAKLKDQKTGLEELIKQNPLASIAIAFGAGYIIAKILNSTGRR